MLVSFEKWNVCETKDIDVSFMPPLSKKGLDEICKLALSSFHKLNIDYDIPLVCASQFGSWKQIVKLGKQLFQAQEISPIAFSRIPHHTFAATISITNKIMLPYTAIAAGNRTFEMGLLEAFTQKNDKIVYIYAEESPPEIFQKFIDIQPIAVSLLISKQKGNYKFSPKYNAATQPKTVFDFLSFFNKKNETFITSNFTIMHI